MRNVLKHSHGALAYWTQRTRLDRSRSELGPFSKKSLLSDVLEATAQRAKLLEHSPHDSEARCFAVPLTEVFKGARMEYPSISHDPAVMGGAPCVSGTRIPVFMVLDAIEYGGTLESAQASYPKLSIQQIKDAIGFAKLVVECPL
jgi:uncharacterized protein (DUF433 family)